MNKYLMIVFPLTLAACSVTKVPQITNLDKETGQVQLTYSHNRWEIPKVQWDQALEPAKRQCKNWGYKPSTSEPELEKTCINQQADGCNNFEVNATVNCDMDLSQRAMVDQVFRTRKAEAVARERANWEDPQSGGFACSTAYGDDTGLSLVQLYLYQQQEYSLGICTPVSWVKPLDSITQIGDVSLMNGESRRVGRLESNIDGRYIYVVMRRRYGRMN